MDSRPVAGTETPPDLFPGRAGARSALCPPVVQTLS